MNRKFFFRDMPVKRKLLSIVALSVAVAMPFAVAMAIAEQWFIIRAELSTSLVSQARILAENTATPLLFGDTKEADKTLGALGNIENIEFAEVRDNIGGLFARYLRRGVQPPPPRQMPERELQSFGAGYIEIFQPVMFGNERIGTIHLRSSLMPMYLKMAWNTAALLAAMLGGMLIAAALTARLHPVITRPIATLAALMEQVSREKNYALRSDFHGKDELGTLGRVFNEMLAQIQARDQALAQHRAQLEKEVAQRTANLTEAQRIAHLGNWEWDIVGNTVNWSDEIYRIFGLAPEEFGATYDAFLRAVHPEDRKFVDAHMRDALELMRPYSIDHRILKPDSSLRYVHEQGEVFRGLDGKPIMMRGTVQDITERKLMEEQIRRLNEELELKVQQRTSQLLQAQEELVRKEKLAVLGQVAGSVGHELRNPLGVMSNAVYFLQTVLGDANESVREYLDIIKNEIMGSERIVSDLLDSVRTKPPQPEPVGVAQLIEQTLRKCAVPSSVTVRLDIPDSLPPIMADPLQIHQIFRNLISNAIDAMPGGGTLEIHAAENRGEKTVTVSVRDTGTGMTPEQIGKLFQPLFTTKARGIGLGLVVVKNLTEANGGRVDVQSAAGKGALFSITLPVEPPATAAERKEKK